MAGLVLAVVGAGFIGLIIISVVEAVNMVNRQRDEQCERRQILKELKHYE